MTLALHRFPRLPRALIAVPLATVAALLLSCSERGPLVANTSSRVETGPGYGVWRPALDQMPKSIADSDADLYRRVYGHQQREDWGAADRAIAQLNDRSLLGHVLASRYLGTYRANRAQLRDWLAKYSDHPDAGRIARIAPAAGTGPRARRASGAMPPTRSTPTPTRPRRSRRRRASPSRSPTIAGAPTPRAGSGRSRASISWKCGAAISSAPRRS